MSTMERALSALAAASPVLAAHLQAVRRDWAPDEPPATIVMGELGLRIVEAGDAVADDELARIAGAVEAALADGPDAVKDAVATGLLEAAMNATAVQPSGARFLRHLGARARAYCQAWDEHTRQRTPGVWD